MKKVTFNVSTGYVGAEREQTFDLVDLGIIEEDYETELDLENAIDESFQEWVWDNINATWEIEE